MRRDAGACAPMGVPQKGGRARGAPRPFILFALLLLLAACGRPNATAPLPPPSAPPLIARAALFGEAPRSNAQLSPRGEMVAFLAPRGGAPNLWVVPVATLGAARPLTNDTGRGVARYQWAENGAHLLYTQDRDGDEVFRLFAVDIASGAVRPLTETGSAEIVGSSPADPTGIIITLNDRDRTSPDLYRVDVVSGARTLIERNTRRFYRYVLDRENHPRLGLRAAADGGVDVYRRTPDTPWSLLFTIPREDALSSAPVAFESGAVSFLMLDSTGRDRTALVRVDAATGAKTVLGESARADVVDVWLNPATNAPQAFAADYLRREWRAIEDNAQADLTFLGAQLAGEPKVVSRSLDDSLWIVVEESPTTPPRSYLYRRGDPAQRSLTLLFRHRPALENAPLQPMIPVEIQSRDGLTLVSYLTLPVGSDRNGDSRPDAPIPLVILPHEGPWSRDSYGFDPRHQWLANRGYAALSVNFRGSAGFGKVFLNQGDREWGGKMQDDLLDAVQWAVEQGVAQPERIAIFGAGYGGFAALHGLAFTPQRFACGIDVAGPSNLESHINALPARLDWMRASYFARVGDPRTAEGREALRQRSPLARGAAIERPLLIAQGARDPRVARAESDQIAQFTRAQRAGLIYLLYPNEGHKLARAGNRIAFYAAADLFLAECLGGRAEALGHAFDAAEMQALAGAAHIEGLQRFAPPRAAQPAAAPAPAPRAIEAEPLETPELPADIED